MTRSARGLSATAELLVFQVIDIADLTPILRENILINKDYTSYVTSFATKLLTFRNSCKRKVSATARQQSILSYFRILHQSTGPVSCFVGPIFSRGNITIIVSTMSSRLQLDTKSIRIERCINADGPAAIKRDRRRRWSEEWPDHTAALTL